MQRNVFKNEIGPGKPLIRPALIKRERFRREKIRDGQHVCYGGNVHTASDVIMHSNFKAKSKRVIHIRNPKIDEMKILI